MVEDGQDYSIFFQKGLQCSLRIVLTILLTVWQRRNETRENHHMGVSPLYNTTFSPLVYVFLLSMLCLTAFSIFFNFCLLVRPLNRSF